MYAIDSIAIHLLNNDQIFLLNHLSVRCIFASARLFRLASMMLCWAASLTISSLDSSALLSTQSFPLLVATSTPCSYSLYSATVSIALKSAVYRPGICGRLVELWQ